MANIVEVTTAVVGSSLVATITFTSWDGSGISAPTGSAPDYYRAVEYKNALGNWIEVISNAAQSDVNYSAGNWLTVLTNSDTPPRGTWTRNRISPTNEYRARGVYNGGSGYVLGAWTTFDFPCQGNPATPPDPDVEVDELTATIAAITLPACADTVTLILDKETSPGSGVWNNQISSVDPGPHEYEGLAGSYRVKWRATNRNEANTADLGTADSAYVPFTLEDEPCVGTDPDVGEQPEVTVEDCSTIKVAAWTGDLPECATSVELWHKAPGESDFSDTGLDPGEEATLSLAAPGTHELQWRSVNETGGVYQGDAFGPSRAIIISNPDNIEATIELRPADDEDTEPSQEIVSVGPIEVAVALQTLGMGAMPDEGGIEWDCTPPVPAAVGGDWQHEFTITTDISVTVTDSHGCVATAEAKVTINEEQAGTPSPLPPNAPPDTEPPHGGGGSEEPEFPYPGFPWPPDGQEPPIVDPDPPNEPPEPGPDPDEGGGITPGPASSPVLAAPTLTGEALDDVCNLDWDAIPGAGSYQVHRAQPSELYSIHAITNNTYFADTDVENGRQYFYLVTAHEPVSGARSPYSNEVALTPVSDGDPSIPPVGGECPDGYTLSEDEEECLINEKPPVEGECDAPYVLYQGACRLPVIDPTDGNCQHPWVLSEDGTQCLLPEVPPVGGECDPPYVEVDGHCYLPEVPPECPPGKHLDESTGLCVDDDDPDEPPTEPDDCDPPWVLYEGSCYLPEIPPVGGVCTLPYVLSDGVCKLPEVPPTEGTTCPDGYYWTGTTCQLEGTQVLAPERPSGIGFDDAASTSHVVVVRSTLPTRADAMQLQVATNPAGPWTALQTVVSGERVGRTGLSPDTIYYYRLRAYNVIGEAFSDTADIKTEPGEGPYTPPPTAPTAPIAPIVTKDCAVPQITVNNVSWTVPAGTPAVTSVDIQRTADNGETVEDVHTFSVAGGTWNDTDVEFYQTWKYRARRSNSVGQSDWGAWSAAVTLESSKLTITFLEPDVNETLTGRFALRFSLADNGSVMDACPTPDIVVRIGGLPLSGDPTIEEPDPCVSDNIEARNTTYALQINTRLYPQGATTLEIEAIGTDCCPKKITRAVTLDNDLEHGVLFRDVQYPYPAPSGNIWSKANVGFENHALDTNPEQRWWLLSRLWTDTAGFALTGDTVEEWEEEFDKMQTIALQKGQGYAASGTRIETQQWYGLAALDKPGQAVTLRTRWEPAEVVNWFETGYERVVKIRKYATDKFLVLARNMNGSGAAVFDFDGTDLTELFDLSDFAAAATFDAARVGDKIFCAYSGGLFYADADFGDASANLTPRGETRPIAFVEAVGTNLIALFVNAALGSDRTRCYRWDGSWRLMWTLDDAVTLAAEGDGKLGLAAGAKLYSSDGGTSAPVLTHTFNSNITALHPAIVGLTNGHVWTHSPVSGWQDAANRPTPITAVAAFMGSLTAERAVAATTTNQLFEQQQDSTAWILGRELEPPAELEDATIDRVAALLQWEIAGDPDTEDDNSDSLLIGTGGSGLFGVLEKSKLSESSGAILTSEIALPALDPIYSLEPEE